MENKDDTSAYDDTAKGGLSYGEKLALVANDLIDPAEVGLKSAEEAKLQIMPPPEQRPLLGDFVTFEASEVPPPLRAKWAREATNIVQTSKGAERDLDEAWIEENQKSMLIQSRMRYGTHLGTFQQEFDRTQIPKVLAFAHFMRVCAGKLEELFKAQNAPATDVAAEVTPLPES